MIEVRLALLAAALLLLGGCATGTDDELAPRPTRTVTSTPSQSLAPAPATVPVGNGEVSPTDVVWGQGTVLHVGRRQVDLAPIAVDAFVVVEGGVFVLGGGELWFTDLQRVSGTGQTNVTGLNVSADASHIEVVDTRSGQAAGQGYDVRTGKAVRGHVGTQSPRERQRGPGRFSVRGGTGGTAASVVESDTGRKVAVTGLPPTFEVGAWSSDSTFTGVGRRPGQGRMVVGCDLVRQRCTPQAAVDGSEPLVFGTGT